MDINSIDQRAHEVWAKLKAAEEKKKLELKKGDRVTQEAAKVRQKAEAKDQPPKKRQRNVQASGSKTKNKRQLAEASSESDDLPLDARVINNAAQTQEADAEHRSLLSWRMQDAEGILLLACAIKHLCARTVRRERIKVGQEYLVKYLTQTAKVRICFNPFNLSMSSDTGVVPGR